MIRKLPSLCCFLMLISIASAEEKPPNIVFAFADDWGRYASAYAAENADGVGSANDVIATPFFDKVAEDGVLFRNAFVNSPSCTPCRSSLFSGQQFYRTGQGAILQGAIWDTEIPVWPLMLRDAGYHIGKVYKVWGPGEPANAPFGMSEYSYEQPGPSFNSFSQFATKLVEEGASVEEAKEVLLSHVGKNFDAFLEARPEGEPFCFYFGPTNVHRKWTRGSGKALWGLDPAALEGKMPEFLPDVPAIREDFADYLGEAMAFDAGLGVLMDRLEKAGELSNTIIAVSGDHGAPGFPRGKCNLYDFGQAVALAISWGDQIKGGRVVDDFVNLPDLAPTFLEAAGITPPEVMTARSLVPLLKSEKSGLIDPERTSVVTGRERHVAAARENFLPYPQRAIRTADHLFIVNFKPERWPMGTPFAEGEVPDEEALVEDTFACFADLDSSPTKAWMVLNRDSFPNEYELGFAKRPERELYILADDPDQVKNVAGQEAYAEIEDTLYAELMETLKATGDPRVLSDDPIFENAPYSSEYVKPKRRKKNK